MRYCEFQPPLWLRPWLRLIWDLELSDPKAFGPPLRIVPDGAFELIVHFGTPFHMRRAGGTEALQPRSLVVSQTERFAEIRPSGPSGLVGVRFHPWGFAAFLKGAAAPFGDLTVAATDVWGRAAADLEEQIAGAASPSARLERALQFLIRHLRPEADARLEHAVRSAWSDPSQSVPQMASTLGSSVRSLQRRFVRDLGMSPGRCLRIARFLRACNTLRAGPRASLTEIGFAHGYYDQSHFIGDFQDLAGMTPGMFAKAPAVAYLRVSG